MLAENYCWICQTFVLAISSRNYIVLTEKQLISTLSEANPHEMNMKFISNKLREMSTSFAWKKCSRKSENGIRPEINEKG